MTYYKHRLIDNEDSPPVHAGVITSFNHGRGTIKQINTGTIYPFRAEDLLNFGIYEGTNVLFSVSRNGTAFNIAKIVSTKTPA